MTWLNRFGLAPKRNRRRPAGKRLESSSRAILQDIATRRNWLAKAGIFIGLMIITMLAFPNQQSYDWSDAKEGEVWRRGDVIAEFDFPIYRSEEELTQQRRKITREIDPIFVAHPNPQAQYQTNVDSLRSRLNRVFDRFADWEYSRSRGLAEKAHADSARYYATKSKLLLAVNDRQWSYLLESVMANHQDEPSGVRTYSASNLQTQLTNQLSGLKDALYRRPSIELDRDSIQTTNILIRDQRTRTDVPRSISEVLSRDQIFRMVEAELNKTYAGKPDTLALGMAMFSTLFQPSLRFEKTATEAQRHVALQTVSTTQGIVKKDQAIVRQGEVVTPEVLSKLQSYSQSRNAGDRTIPQYRIFFGELLISLSIFAVFFLYIFLFRRTIFERNLHMLLIALLFSVFIIAYGILLRVAPGEPDMNLVVPVGILAIMLTIVFDSRVGLFGTLTMALQSGLLYAFDYRLTYLTCFAGMIAVFSVRDIRNRGQFVSTAGLVHFAYATGATAFALLQSVLLNDYLYLMLFVAINAALTLFVYPIIWIIERVFDVTTDLTLLELSDTNRPLLKELSLRAPGTFNHSLQVANLAEAAADAIGANALLTRVGALYHDVGKMSKPEYFIENQRMGLNPLDPLTPRMSALVIANHVKEGLLITEEDQLPKVVRDFVPMHHGTTRIEYFYRKAMDELKPDDPPLLESDFRYPGPKPKTLEAGILMLADGVEAASKSLEKATLRRLEAVIDKIFETRINDGQLEDCPITFYDLHKIKEAFLSVLGGMYHFRLKYPGQEEENDATGKIADPSTEERLIAKKTPAKPVEQAPETTPAPTGIPPETEPPTEPA